MMLGDRKRMILEIIHSRLGPEQAITAERISEMVFSRKSEARTVRAIIAELIIQDHHGEILASNGSRAFPGCPPGYFWAATADQAEAYYHILVSRREEIEHRMQRAWEARNRLRAAPPGQERLL